MNYNEPHSLYNTIRASMDLITVLVENKLSRLNKGPNSSKWLSINDRIEIPTNAMMEDKYILEDFTDAYIVGPLRDKLEARKKKL